MWRCTNLTKNTGDFQASKGSELSEARKLTDTDRGTGSWWHNTLTLNACDLRWWSLGTSVRAKSGRKMRYPESWADHLHGIKCVCSWTCWSVLPVGHSAGNCWFVLGYLAPSFMFLSHCFHSDIHVNASHKLLISKIGGMALFDDVKSYYHTGEMYRGKVIPSYMVLLEGGAWAMPSQQLLPSILSSQGLGRALNDSQRQNSWMWEKHPRLPFTK